MVRSRSVHDVEDQTLFFKSMLPIKTMVGLGLLVGVFLPWYVALPLALLMTWGSLSKAVLGRLGKYKDPLTKLVVPGRKTPIIEGDFVVFHIGARPNKPLDGYFKDIGESFAAMVKELEDHPELGCLGSELYMGVTGTFAVQYWKSLDALNAYARSASNLHASAWGKLMRKLRKCSDYAIWHEAFEVKAGHYDAIFVNCPPMLLGNCHGVKLMPCTGKYKSAAGRAGKTDGSDYPKELDGSDPNEANE